ncbi:MAG TPA: BtpA/SgcQ family protein [Verrucomicrobiae bacterium]|nr:BtpA/SgcQ family protein [Verrucomicrobiae bacterium]
MKSWFEEQPRTLIGVVHLQPLPGSPRYEGAFGPVVAAAVRDARAYERGGAHAVCLENFGDVPFTKGTVAPETVAALAVAGQAVRAAIKLPIGFNVLRNDARAALALCAVCGGRFIRVNVHTGAMVTDQGLIEGQAYETLRCRGQLCPAVLIFADVHVKHATPLGGLPIAIAARDTLYRGLADALIVSGTGTGVAANLTDLQTLRAACPSAKILVGSGVRIENVQDYLPLADGFIVGTSLKTGGQIANAVAVRRVAALAAAMRGARHLTNRGAGHD